jgi:hypothetical protein
LSLVWVPLFLQPASLRQLFQLKSGSKIVTVEFQVPGYSKA